MEALIHLASKIDKRLAEGQRLQTHQEQGLFTPATLLWRHLPSCKPAPWFDLTRWVNRSHADRQDPSHSPRVTKKIYLQYPFGSLHCPLPGSKCCNQDCSGATGESYQGTWHCKTIFYTCNTPIVFQCACLSSRHRLRCQNKPDGLTSCQNTITLPGTTPAIPFALSSRQNVIVSCHSPNTSRNPNLQW